VFNGRVDTGSSDQILAILHGKFQKLKAPFFPLVDFPGEIQRQMGPRDYSEDVFGEHAFLVAE